ncbi:asparaginase [soil metagenome]
MTRTVPRVALLLTGGTIGAFGQGSLDLAQYSDHARWATAEELTSHVPEIADLAAVEPVPVARHRAMSSTLEDLLTLGRQIRECQRTYDGVVIGYGTNALEEAALVAHLMCSGSASPVVFVGAMRPPSGLGTDAYLNLVRSVAVAVAPSSRGRGVLLVMNEEVLSAVEAAKQWTDHIDAFSAAGLGPLGFVDADGAVIYHHARDPGRAVDPRLASVESLPRVDIVASYVGADGALIDASVRAGSRGIVSAGFGAGQTTSEELNSLRRAREAGVLVCQASRVRAGRVHLSAEQQAAGFLAAEGLAPHKARLLLAFGIAAGCEPAELQAMFTNL